MRSSSDNPTDTIIDANDSGTVVTCWSGEAGATLLQEITLTGGNNDDGGEMSNWNSNPTVTNCTFGNNEARTYGGGMSYGRCFHQRRLPYCGLWKVEWGQ